MIKIAKIINDKYYTSPELAEYCVRKTEEIIGKENITEYLEPSAGSGVFLDYLNKPYLAYDIEPEDNRIQKQDYLTLDLEYKQGRCVIGNPPFGEGTRLSNRFCKKSFKNSDFVAMILPICQLNNSIELYEFNLIYSEDLGIKQYSNRNIHCCFNIYKIPENGFNKKSNYKLKDIEIKECRKSRNQFLPKGFDYDIGFCKWGSVGKEIIKGDEGKYQQEMYIKCYNSQFRNKVIDIIRNNNWNDFILSNNSPTVSQWQIYKYIKEQIPEIQ